MQVNKIVTTQDWWGDQQRTRVYRYLEDNQGGTHVRYEEYHFTPYSTRGQLVQGVSKGSLVDNFA